MYCPEFQEEDAFIFDPILSQATKKSNRSSMMPLRMVREVGRQVGQNVGRFGDKVQAAVGNVASELTGKQMFNSNATHSIVIQALERKRCAAAMARRIWMSFVVEGRESLYIEDILEVLGPEHETEAEECFAILDKDGNGDISLDEMILTVTELGRQRKSLNHSMHDVDQAIRVLDNLLFCVAFVVAILVFGMKLAIALQTLPPANICISLLCYYWIRYRHRGWSYLAALSEFRVLDHCPRGFGFLYLFVRQASLRHRRPRRHRRQVLRGRTYLFAVQCLPHGGRSSNDPSAQQYSQQSLGRQFHSCQCHA